MLLLSTSNTSTTCDRYDPVTIICGVGTLQLLKTYIKREVLQFGAGLGILGVTLKLKNTRSFCKHVVWTLSNTIRKNEQISSAKEDVKCTFKKIHYGKKW